MGKVGKEGSERPVGRQVRLWLSVYDSHANPLQQFGRPQREPFLAAFIDLSRGLVIPSQQVARIKHAFNQDFSSKSLFDDDSHFVADGVPRPLSVAEEIGRSLGDPFFA